MTSDDQGLGLVADEGVPAAGEPGPWLGHWDGCSVQFSSICDCDPNNPIDLSALDEDQ